MILRKREKLLFKSIKLVCWWLLSITSFHDKTSTEPDEALGSFHISLTETKSTTYSSFQYVFLITHINRRKKRKKEEKPTNTKPNSTILEIRTYNILLSFWIGQRRNGHCGQRSHWVESHWKPCLTWQNTDSSTTTNKHK